MKTGLSCLFFFFFFCNLGVNKDGGFGIEECIYLGFLFLIIFDAFKAKDLNGAFGRDKSNTCFSEDFPLFLLIS